MKTGNINIYLIGVGGQGIGLLAEAVLRACDHAGLPVRGVDTHGLAQRGGTVQSHIRVGSAFHSPLVPEGSADIIIALERTEALRALSTYGKKGCTLLFYDTEWQSLPVRLKTSEPVTGERVKRAAGERGVTAVPVYHPSLPDTRMQNIVLLAELAKGNLVPGTKPDHFEQALDDLLSGKSLETNIDLFRSLCA